MTYKNKWMDGWRERERERQRQRTRRDLKVYYLIFDVFNIGRLLFWVG
jgi:hypothetical protein